MAMVLWRSAGPNTGFQRSGADPPLSSSRACLPVAFVADSVPFVLVSLGQCHPPFCPLTSRNRVRAGGCPLGFGAVSPGHCTGLSPNAGPGGGGGGAGGTRPRLGLGSDCLPLAAPFGLLPPHILTLRGPERVLVVSTEPLDDLSCLTTPGVGRPGDGAIARAGDQGHPDAHSESMRGFAEGGSGAWLPDIQTQGKAPQRLFHVPNPMLSERRWSSAHQRLMAVML